MAEMGVYYITIMPSMKGFSKAVNKSLKGLGSSGARDYESGFLATLKGSAIGTALGNLATSAGQSIMNGLQTGIGRLDTIENFPKVMESLGYKSEDAQKSIKLIMDRLDGLPTATQDIVTLTQSIADSTGNLDLATRSALAFNDMMLANGASAGEMTQAQGVLNRVLGKGNATVAQWQSIQSVMPAQLAAVARELLGQSGSVEELRDKLNDGTIGWNDFLQAVVKLDEQGSGAMASFEEQARANSHGIGTALENIPNRIGAGWADILKAIGREDISKTIDRMSYGVRDAMSGIGDAIGDLKNRIGETGILQNLQTIMSDLGERFGGFAETVSGAVAAATPVLVDLVDDALQWIVDHGDQIKGLLDSVSSALGSVADAISGALADALPVAKDLVSAVLQWVLDNGDTVSVTLGAIAGGLGAFAAAQAAVTVVAGLSTSLGALAAVLPMVSTLADIPVAFALVAETGGPLAGLFGGISAALGFLAANPLVLAVGAIGALVGALAVWITTTEDGKKAWEDFCNGVKQLIENLKADFQRMVDRIKQNLEDNKVQWELFKQNVANAMESIRTAVTEKWNAAKTAVTTTVENIRSTVTQKWEAVKSSVTTAAESMRSAVVEKWNAVKTRVSEVVGGIRDTVSNGFTSAKDAVLGVFESIRSGIESKLRAAKDTVSCIIDSIKGLFDFSWSLPAPRLPHIDWHWNDIGGMLWIPVFDGISWYAKGGVFDRASVIGIGEAGREAALPLNDRTYSEIAGGIASRLGAVDDAPAVLVTGNTFVVRADDDIERIADAIALRTSRQRGGAL